MQPRILTLHAATPHILCWQCYFIRTIFYAISLFALNYTFQIYIFVFHNLVEMLALKNITKLLEKHFHSSKYPLVFISLSVFLYFSVWQMKHTHTMTKFSKNFQLTITTNPKKLDCNVSMDNVWVCVSISEREQRTICRQKCY